jgi:hypothetical protein
MDVEGLLQSVIRFSNFMTSRLIVAGVFFYVASGFTDLGSATEGFLPDLDLINGVIANYQTIFDILGVSDFALLLILFVFLTTIHLVHTAFDRIGHYIPPAIAPLSGWDAIEDMTHPAFEVLRDARGVEHSDAENQRLFEFERKLREIDAENEESWRVELEDVNAAFRISKAMALIALLVWVYAMTTGSYTGDSLLLLVILGTSLLVAGYCAFRLFKAHHERIESVRGDVASQFIGFSRIWTPSEHQAKVQEACVPSADLRPAVFQLLIPMFGTVEQMKRDVGRFRQAINRRIAKRRDKRG